MVISEGREKSILDMDRKKKKKRGKQIYGRISGFFYGLRSCVLAEKGSEEMLVRVKIKLNKGGEMKKVTFLFWGLWIKGFGQVNGPYFLIDSNLLVPV